MKHKIQRHPHYTKADYDYLAAKGYTDTEITAIWDRDRAIGKEPKTHEQAAFDLVGYLNQ